MIRFTVPGAPVAKGRARTGRAANGAPVHYTPARTRSYEALVALAAQAAMAGREPYARNMPLHMLVIARVPIPASWSARKSTAAAEDRVLPTSRPDLDNFLKAALDGCLGVVFADDSSVVRVEARKEYAPTPNLTIQVTPLTSVEGA
jgi:Holliday junction resolvase RusA-like endonuclease